MLGNGSENCEVPIETASDSNLEQPQLQQMRTDAKGTREQEVLRQITDELFSEHATELLNKKELQNEADKAEPERLENLAMAEADRLKSEATFAKAEADRQLARERLLL